MHYIYCFAQSGEAFTVKENKHTHTHPPTHTHTHTHTHSQTPPAPHTYTHTHTHTHTHTYQATFIKITKVVTLNEFSASRSGFAVTLVDASNVQMHPVLITLRI